MRTLIELLEANAIAVRECKKACNERDRLKVLIADFVKLVQDSSEDDFNTSAACRKIWNEAEKMRCLLPDTADSKCVASPRRTRRNADDFPVA